MTADLNPTQTELKALQALTQRYQQLVDDMSSGVAIYESPDNGQNFIFVELNKAAEKISGAKREEIIGRSVSEIYPTVIKYGLLEVFQRVWRTGQPEFYPETEFREENFSGWIENYVYKLPGGELVSKFRDVTERKVSEDALTRQKELLESVIEAIDQPFCVIDVQDFSIELANNAARGLTKDTQITTCYALMHKLDAPCTGPDHACPLMEVVQKKQPVLLEHVHVDAGGQPFPVEVRAYPLFDESGNVNRIIEHTLDISGRKRAEQAAQAAAAAGERSRLARDLHDSVSQNLFSAGLIAELLPELWNIDQAQARSSLDKLRQLIRATSAEMRSMLLELHPEGLVEASFNSLLDQLCESLTNRSETTVHKEICLPGVFLPVEVKITLFRIIQEAFNNIAKHAHAQKAWLNCLQEEDKLQIIIRDDGRGFDPQNIPAGHFGLTIMGERTAQIGGRLHVASAPNAGTIINVVWAPSAGERHA